MKRRRSGTWQAIGLALLLAAGWLVPAPASAQAAFVVKPISEKKVDRLPAGPLYWQLETFPTLAEAQAAAGSTALAAEIAGKAWLFTLGAQGAAAHGGRRVAEIGPVAPVAAPAYLLRVNHASGPSGAHTKTHSHPGTEAFYVLDGELSQKTPDGTSRAEAGQSMPGHAPGTPMEVSSSGAAALSAVVLFVVDATKPFSSPAHLD
jgi:quercetin dioxygenase-like cupin family protein